MGGVARTEAFDRFSALDAAFLDAATATSPLTIGAMAIFAAGSLVAPNGALRVDVIRSRLDAATISIPRYRQRIARTPLVGQPVWVDDDHFQLDYHVRHVRLPEPGDDRQLRRTAAQLFSTQIDLTRPPWLAWCVEGLHGGRFAMVLVAQHCLADGAAGIGLIEGLLQPTPTETLRAAKMPWQPRPTPSKLALLGAELSYRQHESARLVGKLLRRSPSAHGAVAHTSNLPRVTAASVWRGGADLLRAAFVQREQTPLTPPSVDAYRRFDTATIPLADVRHIAARLGGKVNDVILAIVTGALRQFLIARGLDADRLGPRVALVPVNLRRPGDHQSGNQLALLLARLPTDVADARQRYVAVQAELQRLKAKSGHVAAVALVASVANAAATGLVREAFRIATWLRAFDVLVTNVRGPERELFLADAKLEALFPMAPLYERQAIGVAALSYSGVVYIGFSAAWSLVPDLHDVALAVQAALEELQQLAS